MVLATPHDGLTITDLLESIMAVHHYIDGSPGVDHSAPRVHTSVTLPAS